MIKADYLGYRIDVIEAWDDHFEAQYIDYKAKHMIKGTGRNIESACADAQKKIQKRVNDTKTPSN